jgi:hypothetical protein
VSRARTTGDTEAGEPLSLSAPQQSLHVPRTTGATVSYPAVYVRFAECFFFFPKNLTEFVSARADMKIVETRHHRTATTASDVVSTTCNTPARIAYVI